MNGVQPRIASSRGGSMRHNPILHTFVCALAITVAGCGGEPTNEASASGENAGEAAAGTVASADPCSFISKEEVTAVLGETILETKSEDQTCRYETDDPASAIQVDIKQSGGREEMGIARSASGALGSIGDDMKNAGGAEGDTGEILAEKAAAPKIGDQSFFGMNTQLHVLKGDTYFAVLPPIMRSRMSADGNPLLSSEKKREIAVAIAQKIVTKI